MQKRTFTKQEKWLFAAPLFVVAAIGLSTWIRYFKPVVVELALWPETYNGPSTQLAMGVLNKEVHQPNHVHARTFIVRWSLANPGPDRGGIHS